MVLKCFSWFSARWLNYDTTYTISKKVCYQQTLKINKLGQCGVIYVIFILTAGFILGYAGAWIVMRYGAWFGTIDIPNSRSSHCKAVPKGAGLGILATMMLSGLVLKIHWFIWLPALVISIASFWGADKYILPVSARLAIHFVCSLFFVFFLLNFRQADAGSYMVCLPAMVFIAGTANFYNFMDGIDGIAGITGFIAFGLVAFHARLSGADMAFIGLSLALAFSCLGFLCFNIPRAKVFLGDVGSILLGFVFACFIVFLSENLMDFLVMAGFLAPFYFDEIYTMIVRIRHKDILVKPHRKHIYQLLANEGGIGHWKISLGYGTLQMIIGLAAILIHPWGMIWLLGFYAVCGLIFAGFYILIRKRFATSEN
jgi:Fuc2NAc and GlcNAc transferase